MTDERASPRRFDATLGGQGAGVTGDARRATLNVSLQPDAFVVARFLEDVLERQLPHVAAAQWPTTTRLDTLDAAATFFGEGQHHAYVELGAAVALALASFGTVNVFAAAASVDEARAAVDELRRRLPETEPSEDETVIPVVFWSASAHGPAQIHRELTAPSWEEIRENYPDDVRGSLDAVMNSEFRPERGGQLLLWHGETGTGKTTALRALAREWRDWCTIHYITDPEKFFGEMADYMLEVMLQGEMGFHAPEDQFDEELDEGGVLLQMGDSTPMTPMMPMGPIGPIGSMATAGFSFPGMIRGGRRRGAWRLLVLEDAGELLAADARAATGQGLSRFLNAVDGLIGQGLRFLILVTTNEELGRLHPAVARPGRAAMKTAFKPLPKDAARAWLEKRGAAHPHVTEATTLAALYARLEGHDDPQPSRPLGFRG